MFDSFFTVAGTCYVYLGSYYLMTPRPLGEPVLNRVIHIALGIALLAVGTSYMVGGIGH